LSIDSISSSSPLGRFLVTKNGLRDLGQPLFGNKTPDSNKAEVAKKKLVFSQSQNNLLQMIAKEYEKQKAIFKGVWKKKVLDYLKNLNTEFEIRTAVRDAYKFVTGKPIKGSLNRKIKDFEKIVLDRYFQEGTDRDLIGFMTNLGNEASYKTSNSEFHGRHILMLGEHHLALEEHDFLHPPSKWLEENLDRLKAAGYDTLALEVPENIDNEDWVIDGNSIWNPKLSTHLKTIKQLSDLAIKYAKRQGHKANDVGIIAFQKAINDWLKEKQEESKTKKSVDIRPNRYAAKKENTSQRWLKLAKAAKEKGFKIVTTDAHNKVTHKGERIAYFMRDKVNQVAKKTEGLKAISDYFEYIYGAAITKRDKAIAKNLESALRESDGNVIGLYGENHVCAYACRGQTTAYKELKAKQIPVASLRMEFDGFNDEKHKTLLTQRVDSEMLEEPIAIRLSDLHFGKYQRIKDPIEFENQAGQYKIKSKQGPTRVEQEPFDAVALFPIKAA
jgi:hypothetical protein